MLKVHINLESGVAKLTVDSATALKPAEVQLVVVLSDKPSTISAPGVVTMLQLSLTSLAGVRLAFADNDTFTKVDDVTYTADLIVNTDEVATLMAPKLALQIVGALKLEIDDAEFQETPDFKLWLQPTRFEGPEPSEAGPIYLTTGNIDTDVTLASPSNSKVPSTLAIKTYVDTATAAGGVVSSVNTQTGAVVLTTSHIAEGSNLYFTNARADARIAASVGATVQGYSASATTLGNTTTGTGSIVRATSPTFAGATITTSTVNGITLAGTGGSTLNVGAGGTLGSAAYVAASDYLAKAGNLSGLASASAARANLGLDSAALHEAGDFEPALTISTGLDRTGSTLSLKTATTSVLGGVKVDGTSITISGGVISSTGGGGSIDQAAFDALLSTTTGQSVTVFYLEAGNIVAVGGSSPAGSFELTGTGGGGSTAVQVSALDPDYANDLIIGTGPFGEVFGVNYLGNIRTTGGLSVDGASELGGTLTLGAGANVIPYSDGEGSAGTSVRRLGEGHFFTLIHLHNTIFLSEPSAGTLAVGTTAGASDANILIGSIAVASTVDSSQDFSVTAAGVITGGPAAFTSLTVGGNAQSGVNSGDASTTVFSGVTFSSSGSNSFQLVKGTGQLIVTGGLGVAGLSIDGVTLGSAAGSAATDFVAVSATQAVNRGGTGQTSYTNGQLLIGNTSGNTLTKATLTGTTNQIVVTNSTGSITLSLPQDIATSSAPTFVGTNFSGTAASLTAGNVTTIPTLSGDVANSGNAVFIGASKVTNTMLAGSIAASKLVGTDIATVGTLTAGATGAGFTVALTTSTVTGNVPLANTAALTGDVTKAAGNNATVLANIPAISGANLTTLNGSNISSGTVAAGRGGTGVSNTSTITLGGNLVTSGAFNTTFTVTATTGVTLPTTGTLATLAGSETLTNHTLGSGTVITAATMTLGSDAAGDIFYRASGGLLTRLAVGSDTQVLTLASGLPSWAAAGGGVSLAGTNTWTGQNTFAAGTITTSQPATLTQTWNASGVTFTGLKIAITDQASNAGSAAASKPLEIFGGTAGTSSLLAVDKVGKLALKMQGTYASVSTAWISLQDSAGTEKAFIQNVFGVASIKADLLGDITGNTSITATAYKVGSGFIMSWGNSAYQGTQDVGLARDSGGVLGFTNGASANTSGSWKATNGTLTGTLAVTGASTVTGVLTANGGLTIGSGQALKLGNAATTGLTAGVLAATTNATISITDSTGQVYRIPCII